MRPLNSAVFNDLDASVNHSSAALKSDFMVSLSVQGVVAGASTGAIKVQFSNDPSHDPSSVVNWSDLSGAAATISSAGVFAIPKQDLCYNWIRLVYTKNNGSAGTITANYQAWGL